MKTRKFLNVLVLLGLLGFFGLSTGLAYVGSTIMTYRHAAPCGKLTGVAGYLQAAHFIPTSDCKVAADGSCSSSGSTCKISNPPSGAPSQGKCTTINLANSKKSCVCQ